MDVQDRFGPCETSEHDMEKRGGKHENIAGTAAATALGRCDGRDREIGITSLFAEEIGYYRGHTSTGFDRGTDVNDPYRAGIGRHVGLSSCTYLVNCPYFTTAVQLAEQHNELSQP